MLKMKSIQSLYGSSVYKHRSLKRTAAFGAYSVGITEPNAAGTRAGRGSPSAPQPGSRPFTRHRNPALLTARKQNSGS